MRRKIFYFLKFYFGFTKRESRGFLFIMPSLILLYFIPIIYQRCINHVNEEDYRKYVTEAETYFATISSGSSGNILTSDTALVIPKFNPNIVDKDFLISIGVDPRTASNWVKYSSSGATFKDRKDLSKIYGLEDSVLFRIKDYMVFDTVPGKKVYKKPTSPGLKKIPFAEADSITLQIVPGIGSGIAGRIIKFRENLGGLHSRNQLLDVYGVEEELMNRVFEYFTFEPGTPKQIDINSLSIADLAKHPYITYAQAKVIVAYRDQHGPFQKAGDLLKIKIFSQEWLDKLEPYLDL